MSLLLDDTIDLDPRELVWAPDGHHVFYPHESFVAAGYYALEPFQTVVIDGVVYELQGRIGKHMVHPVGGYWWIEPLVEAEAVA